MLETCHANHPGTLPPPRQVLSGLASASANGTSAAALRSSVPKETIIGLFRDLRGIATATNSRRTYGALARHVGLPPACTCLAWWTCACPSSADLAELLLWCGCQVLPSPGDLTARLVCQFT